VHLPAEALRVLPTSRGGRGAAPPPDVAPDADAAVELGAGS
jgi:hypothetical protein